ncbi:MAG TPA: sterol desaturase family protein [Sphingomonas sp.]|jgi:sterol desaturase/sphingolipid hydroxylase (fatty acid hydroxylase superfamily)
MPTDASPFAAFLQMFQRVATFDGGRYVVGVAAMFAVLALVGRTPWRARRIQPRRASAADMRRELKASAVSIVVYAAVATPTFWLRANGHLPSMRIEPQGVLHVAAYLGAMMVAHDTWFYWTHRLMHHRRLFRTFHRLHHRSTTPTPFAAYAFNATEAAVEALFFVLWINIVPTPWIAIFLFLALVMLRNVWGHSGVELMPAGFADHRFWGLFATTTHHDLHHGGGFDTNYALYFTWWDRMMGTEHPRYREIFREVTGRTATASAQAARA